VKVVVTGSTGFIGQHLLSTSFEGIDLLPVSLRLGSVDVIPENGIDCVVHLAGKAHDMTAQRDEEYFEVNRDLTKALAERAIACRIPHFVFMSTAKVYGDAPRLPLNEESSCLPEDPYSLSKYQAEQALLELRNRGTSFAFVRPPVVYGPGVKGNILRLLELASSRTFLPLGGIANRRSMVYVGNLNALLASIISNRSEGVFLPADSRPVSTSELVTEMRECFGLPPRLFAVPKLVKIAFSIFRPRLYERLFGDFVLESVETNRKLGFVPPYSSSQGIGKMVDWYKSKQIEGKHG
jgi:nucleoside-diphosphate-sugar epimerase